MIMKFEETGDLGVLPGRGRKPVENETVEEVGTAVIERASCSIYFSARVASGSTPKSPVSSNFMIIFFKPILDMGPLRRAFKRRYSHRATKWLLLF
ncbi:hypothetical protein TNCV_1008011 [Trichonephila clavipes]|nr:hypothetical protein TNCV_1008011 [Trichonephila clavipes]